MKQEPPTDRNRCAATKPDGTPCRAGRVAGTPYCIFHQCDPEARERSAEARRRGGENSARLTRALRRLPADLRAVYDRLAEALDQVHSGALDPTRAHAMAALSRAMVAVLDSAETLRRLDDIEDVLEGLDLVQALG